MVKAMALVMILAGGGIVAAGAWPVGAIMIVAGAVIGIAS